MWEDPNYRAVVLAALLHDVGKLYQRGEFPADFVEGQHPKIGATFVSAFRSFFEQSQVDPDLLQTLVQRHHQNSRAFPSDLLVQDTPDPTQRALALLVSTADHLSASERGEHGPLRNSKTVPVASIFHSLELQGHLLPSHTANLHAAPITDLASLASAFPQLFDLYARGELNQIITAFGEEFNKRLTPELTGNFQSLLAHLINILYRYTWCIAADTQEEQPDISLYDHLRTTCAIAACLYQRHHPMTAATLEAAIRHEPSGEEFSLVAGDVSGIQSYIFDIAHIGEGGVARRLRARSLMVQLFTEVAAREILARLDLPQACQIMAAGGNFYLLLPNTLKAQTTIREVSQDVEHWSLEQLHGELALNLESVEMSRSDFQGATDNSHGFGGVLRQVNERLGLKKRQRFQSTLAQGDPWADASPNGKGFLIDVPYQGARVCASCGKHPVLSEDDPAAPEDAGRLCWWCRTDRETGKALPTAKVIYLSKRRSVSSPITLPLGWYAGVGQGPGPLGVDDIAVQLNDFRLESYGRREASARFMANHIPDELDDNGQRSTLTFEKIAKEAQGREMLGFLKMDVDNLGELMVFGLKRSTGEHRDTISRIMTISRSLDTFFTGWVQRLLETPEFNTCYVIFSGGDDLFVAGPWAQVLEVASRVREDFRKWVVRDEVTISAGVVFTHPRYPISRAAHDADEALEASKQTAGKDRIHLLGHSLAWQEWQALSKRWKEVERWCNAAQVSTAFRYSLLEYGRMWQRYDRWRKDPKDDPGGVLGLRFQPLLAYNISRNLKRDDARELYQWAEGLTRPQPGWSVEQQLEVQHLELLAQLLIMGKKKEDRE